ncbi:MAG: 30S ribosome-binding factor RbfA [Brevibacterium yomogidense]|uniref:30S ribosome-binding factor RbfA n=1 Tax=Brevibacterium sp. Mu109 TaxID=1255669 RepID=UPI000C3CE927|nr:30S ribosome-binding factor RbfA [Brevibacterium sp. Mu109]SMX69958.1 ribosome-binding factor A [Brevibacterium sp. Mu109]
MADSTRARKVADRIKVIVASTLEKRVKDPRLGFVTVTDVRLTGDLQNATVFYTVFGTDTDLEATRAALESARGLIRSEVGKGLTIRLTPTIEFVADAVPAAAAELDELLARAKARDAEIAELARDADPVGDPDPYRRGPDEEASDAESGAQDRSHD